VRDYIFFLKTAVPVWLAGGELREALPWDAGAWGWWGAVCACTRSLHNLMMSPWGRRETEKEQIINNTEIIYMPISGRAFLAVAGD